MGAYYPGDKELEKLVKAAQAMCDKAYCNYSKVRVGAALLCADGTIITGCNVENASYGLTICAERTALVKAVSEGHRTFKAIAVASNMNDFTMPCGACRQFIVEFGANIMVHSAATDGRVMTKRIDELLPFFFGPAHLPPK
ncbi:cytidine deaminase-like isoform X1 [Haemaphysalis longicornis]